MKTRYTTTTGTDQQVARFLEKLPVDNIVERAEVALDMFPAGLHINIVLMDSKKEVQEYYKEKYGKDCDYVAFISLDRMTIYVSLKDVTERILAHEIGHAIVEQYFTERPPYKIHELLAQYCERNF